MRYRTRWNGKRYRPKLTTWRRCRTPGTRWTRQGAARTPHQAMCRNVLWGRSPSRCTWKVQPKSSRNYSLVHSSLSRTATRKSASAGSRSPRTNAKWGGGRLKTRARTSYCLWLKWKPSRLASTAPPISRSTISAKNTKCCASALSSRHVQSTSTRLAETPFANGLSISTLSSFPEIILIVWLSLSLTKVQEASVITERFNNLFQVILKTI